MTEPTPKTEELPREVRAGPGWTTRFASPLFGLLALGSLAYVLLDGWEKTPFWLVLFSAVALLIGLWRLPRDLGGRVIADESGLRWRARDGWRSASWMEVRDFYQMGFSGLSSSVIETEHGEIDIEDTWTGYEELRRVVAARATAAESYRRGWAPQEKRPPQSGVVR